jgi:hypothetical protein
MLKWIDDNVFELDGIRFTIDVTPGSDRRASERGNFTLVKTRQYLADYLALEGEKFEHILELGIFQGGSLVFFDKLFKPKKLVGVDISRNRIEALDHYVTSVAGHMKVYYESSQGDEALLRTIVAEDLGGQLDLVIDDASHLYELTKTSLSVLFPLLAPGGTYLIEDWAWSHGPRAQAEGHPWEQQPALTNLLFEMIVELGGSRVVEEIHINHRMVRLTKSATADSTAVLEKPSLRGATLSPI